jgi:nucleotide-binding universal stress UspA family protein
MNTMSEGFNRVLAIVDFTPATIHAAEEAAKLAAKFNSSLHLLFVTTRYSVTEILSTKNNTINTCSEDDQANRKIIYRLEKTKIDLSNRFGVNTKTHVAIGNLKEIVSNYVQEFSIDLVVVSAKKKTGIREFLYGSTAEAIIDAVDCEVLCVYPQSDCSHLKKIVLPVGKFIPKRKIKLAYELARKFAASIHLVSLNSNNGKKTTENIKVLLDAFRYLKDITNIPVECKTVSGVSIAEATVNYAESIGADIILVNHGPESQWPGSVLYRGVNDIINRSHVPVLSVHSILDRA